MNNQPAENSERTDWMEDYEGQLAIDVYQDDDHIIVKAPIAGVSSIKGERKDPDTTNRENYFAQECYWGPFSRSYILPIAVESEKTTASLKDGLLTIKIPKLEKTKTKTIEIKTE
jgi:HSP20 family protein